MSTDITQKRSNPFPVSAAAAMQVSHSLETCHDAHVGAASDPPKIRQWWHDPIAAVTDRCYIRAMPKPIRHCEGRSLRSPAATEHASRRQVLLAEMPRIPASIPDPGAAALGQQERALRWQRPAMRSLPWAARSIPRSRYPSQRRPCIAVAGVVSQHIELRCDASCDTIS